MSTLSEAIAARTECMVDECHEQRVEGALFCKVNGHLTEAWRNRLAKTPTGWTTLPHPRWLGTAKELVAA